ncbi:hypothetical protein [Paenibacillus planticolens]|uniref:Uncharacterized protein n=1 Tax=Paenibacillus planticolens TaxID=2654976 RepID=A0ABX1ZP97_9BACL|nr:hypothetical protein [Paenibacillus planticolens]NOV01914.1 hypothetical protein [Paenibacillus planticolens]
MQKNNVPKFILDDFNRKIQAYTENGVDPTFRFYTLSISGHVFAPFLTALADVTNRLGKSAVYASEHP